MRLKHMLQYAVAALDADQPKSKLSANNSSHRPLATLVRLPGHDGE